MANKMLIDATHPEETRVVVVRGQRVEEFDFESASRKQLRGNIYLAKVTRVEPSLQAAFVEYGGNRHGFLAFSEIHPDYYQIPVADRQALLEEEARAEREEEREEERRREEARRRSAAKEAARSGEAVRSERLAGEASEEGQRADLSSELATPLAEVQSGDAEPRLDGEMSPAEVEAEPAADLPNAALSTAEAAGSDGGAEAPSIGSEAEGTGGELPAGEWNASSQVSREGVSPNATTADDDLAPQELEASTAEEGSDDETTAPRSAFEGQVSPVEVEDPGDQPGEDLDDETEQPIEQVGGRGDALEELPERRRPLRRQYKIQEVIKRRQIMLVQVVKEERGNKGAALTTYLSLAGRYSVLMPNTGRGGGISRKITNAADRKRLKEIAQELEVPEGMGVILRTAGASRTRQEIKRDFEYLMRLWESVRELTLRSTAPALVYEEGSLIKRAIRDLYNKDIDEILVAGDDAYREAKEFMRMLMPSHAKVVKPYRDPQPLFARYGVEQQLDAMFSNHVTLKSGGYLVINPTEALVSIDVNSGRATREHNIEDTALKTNLEAAEEIARQLRLRDLAGLIVIDFIDMEEKRNNRAVEKRLNECLKNDRARIQVGRISPFGLLEMSRQRIRTGVLESSSVPCPHCGGSGHVRATPSVALQILRSVEEALIKSATHNLAVRTRTAVAFYILNQKRSHLRELEERFGVNISIVADEQLTGAAAFAIDRLDPVTRLEPRPAITSVQIDAVAPPEDFEEPEAPAEESDEAEASRLGEPEESRDEEGGRRRRRRRRRRGRGGEAREEYHAGSEIGVADDQQAGEQGGFEDAGPAEPEDASAPAERRERGGRRRRRGRDRWQDREAERSVHATTDEQGVEGPEPLPAMEAASSHALTEPSTDTSLAPEVEPSSSAAPALVDDTGTREAVMPTDAPMATAAAEVPSKPAEPEPEPVAIVLTPPDPDRPKRAGWWSRAKAAFSGGSSSA